MPSLQKQYQYQLKNKMLVKNRMEKRAICLHVRDNKKQKHVAIWRRISDFTLIFTTVLMFCMLENTYCHNTTSAKETTNNSNTTALFTTTNFNGTEGVETFAYKNSINLNVVGYESDTDDSFQPLVPENVNSEFISRNVFTNDGHYRVFQPVESDLRYKTIKKSTKAHNERASPVENENAGVSIVKLEERINNGVAKELLKEEETDLEILLAQYIRDFFGNKADYIPSTTSLIRNLITDEKIRRLTRNADNKINDLEKNISSSKATGRLLISAGLKKFMWPIYMGFQILKSLLFAMLLPTLIGSVGQLLGKGVLTGSAPLFIRPMDVPQELDFKDNTFNFDDDSNKFLGNDGANNDLSNVNMGNYVYQQQEASQLNNQYAPLNPNSINQLTNSRYGMLDQKIKMPDSYLSALQSISSASFKNSNSISGASLGGIQALASRNKPVSTANVNTYQTFQKVPASSLLFSNYDPFYSPLLSRLDSVFAQLKLKSENEECREKAICLMYANPAKYAPYSNLVSAQLSRELNELRKPTSDNPEILRFFKYMRAAKDGQDGIDCEKTFDSCKEFKDYENPAMISTFHDINKLVQARKII